MRREFFGVVLIFFLVCLIFVSAVYFDPNAVRNRQQIQAVRTAKAIEQTEVLAPLVLFAKGAALLGVIVLAIGLPCVLVYFAFLRASMVFAKNGLFPQRMSFVGMTGAGDNDTIALRLAAAVNGSQRPSAGMRQLMRDESQQLEASDQLLLEAPLPASASIYTAPLPSNPSLLLGAGTDGDIALPLRNLGGGMVGGLQGMGKSELVASMIAGLLRQDCNGRIIKIGLVDMKGGLDFGRIPNDLAAWQWPIATDEGSAVSLVTDFRLEIERRQELLLRAGVPNIETYNSKVSETLPYLIVFIDELMLLTAPSMEAGLSKLDKADSRTFVADAMRCLAVGRATGASLIMATQKPSADVVPTRIRDLTGFKIAFRTTTVQHSMAILGTSGAELLPDDPGHAILFKGAEPVHLRTYMAGIESGKFDQFTYSLTRGNVPLLPNPSRLLLTADGEADGEGDEDMPSTTTTTTTNWKCQNEAILRPNMVVGSGSGAGSKSAALRGKMFRYWQNHDNSLAAVEREFSPYHKEGGSFHYEAAAAINAQLMLQGKPPRYLDERPR